MSYDKVLVFAAAVRGFHFYSEVWDPKENEELCCLHESNNVFDMFAIKTCQIQENKVVGHLPREISRPTKILLDRGAKITATLSSTKFRRSPLFQGGLEIQCNVKVCLPVNIKTDMLLGKYRELIDKLYMEPKEEVIVGCFMDKLGNKSTDCLAPKRKIKKKDSPVHKKKDNNSKDIRQFFKVESGKKKQ